MEIGELLICIINQNFLYHFAYVRMPHIKKSIQRSNGNHKNKWNRSWFRDITPEQCSNSNICDTTKKTSKYAAKFRYNIIEFCYYYYICRKFRSIRFFNYAVGTIISLFNLYNLCFFPYLSLNIF